jgi:enoyl-CoA hydratase/carnithine racemase
LKELIDKELLSAICIITLSDPENYNALSAEMVSQFSDALNDAAADERVRVIIIRANGKAFCVGHDLREMTKATNDADGGRAFHQELFSSCSALMQSIVEHPKPVIAQVQGVATAAGCQLVASCDLAIAANVAKFGVNGIDVGLFCSTPMVALTRNVTKKQAFEMLVTGGFVSANRAMEIGLINRAVPFEQLENETLKLANIVARKLPSAITLGKKAFNRHHGMHLSDAYDYTAKVMTENMLEADTVEGINAFLEKRKPSWLAED